MSVFSSSHVPPTSPCMQLTYGSCKINLRVPHGILQVLRGEVVLLQVLPLVEAFFVLCDARTAHLPPLPELSPARSLEQQLPSIPAMPAGAAATPAQHPHGTPTAACAAVNEAHLPFLR